MFQPMLVPHSAIQAICGARLATIRAITLTNNENSTLFRACWKIPSGRHFADNYWRSGNLIGQLDLSSGRVLRVLSGMGLSLSQYERHPDTQAAIVGFEIPHWSRIVETILNAARVMRPLGVIGWDVAVLDNGPVIVEMNESPDFGLTQLADGRGILDEKFIACMRSQKHAASARKNKVSQILKHF